MAESDKTSKAAIAISVGAAVAAAVALTQKRAQGATPGSTVSLDEATMNLLIAIAQASGSIDSNTLEALTKLQAIIDKIATGGGRGWPPNTEGIRSFTVLCVAALTSYQAPEMAIPDGMNLVIKASPLNAAPSFIYVGRTPAESTNPNSSWWLIPNEPIGYAVKNTDTIYISSNIAGSIALFTAEKT